MLVNTEKHSSKHAENKSLFLGLNGTSISYGYIKLRDHQGRGRKIVTVTVFSKTSFAQHARTATHMNPSHCDCRHARIEPAKIQSWTGEGIMKSQGYLRMCGELKAAGGGNVFFFFIQGHGLLEATHALCNRGP